jgi:hypothetical protein
MNHAQERMLRNLHKRATAFGYMLAPATQTP